jgi:hypothetical protein
MPRATALTSAAVSARNRQVHADEHSGRIAHEGADGVRALQWPGISFLVGCGLPLSKDTDAYGARVQHHVLERGGEERAACQRQKQTRALHLHNAVRHELPVGRAANLHEEDFLASMRYEGYGDDVSLGERTTAYRARKYSPAEAIIANCSRAARWCLTRPKNTRGATRRDAQMRRHALACAG